MNCEESIHEVSFAAPTSFGETCKSQCLETFFPDDPFRKIRNEQHFITKLNKGLQYFVPIFSWLPRYNLNLFKFDLLAGITITSLAIPQGISYANLAGVPPIIGLYSSFVPPLIYSLFGSSNYLAVGTVATSSLLLSSIIGGKVSAVDDPKLYLHLVFAATFFAGILQTALGILRLGILVDFLSHSTIIGFMGGTAVIIFLQQLKGFLGLKHFTTKTNIVSVLHEVFEHRNEWRWQSALMGAFFLIFLQITKYVKVKRPKLFWVSATAPMVVVITGGIIAYLGKTDHHGIKIVGDLHRGINPSSIKQLNFQSRYLSTTLQAGIITGLVALVEGIAIGRSFATMKNEQIDGNKEMVAFGLMNIIGSFTSCYLTTGPFSKTAVNFNAGARTAMANIVMSIAMMLTLLFLAPLFSHTPMVALSTIIMSAVFGFVKYDEAIRLFRVDKFDFVVCMAAFLGVTFLSMDYGLLISVGLALLRALLYMARPATYKLGRVPGSILYRDMEQYPGSTTVPGIVSLQLGSPIFFPNCNYVRERIVRLIEEESSKSPIKHVLLDLGGVSSIDMTGIELMNELENLMNSQGIKMGIVNPRREVMEKMIRSQLVDKIEKNNFFLCMEDAIEACITTPNERESFHSC